MKGWMDWADIEGAHWWRVCVAAGWISHPCLFSFAISNDAQRIEAVSVLSWNVAEHRAFLCSRAFRWFAVAAEAVATVRGKAGWGGGVVVGVMDIFVWCGHWDEKTVGELLLPASLCVKTALSRFHLISRKRMWSYTCIQSVHWKHGQWPICALQASSKYFCCFLLL